MEKGLEARMRRAAEITFNKLREKEKFLESYFESREFERAFRIIHAEESIDQERLAYEIQKVEGLTPDQFGKVCNSVFHKLEKTATQVPGEFPHYIINYRGVGFNLMIGQGSTYWTEKLK